MKVLLVTVTSDPSSRERSSPGTLMRAEDHTPAEPKVFPMGVAGLTRSP
jgi:hypothetical protein